MRECYNSTCKAIEYEAEIESLKKQLTDRENMIRQMCTDFASQKESYVNFLNSIRIKSDILIRTELQRQMNHSS